MNDVLGGIDDTLGKIAGVAHDPLRLRCEAGEKAAHTQHENFLFHKSTFLMMNNRIIVSMGVKVPFFALWTAGYGG